MASTTLLVIVIALAISVEGSRGKKSVSCDDLTEDSCAFAVSSSGKRCLLEKSSFFGSKYACRSSDIVADKLRDWVERDECISACGVERKALGISSDSLLDRSFAGRLCSEQCYRNCPNILDLYFNLAAGEGVYLPAFCEARQSNSRRELDEIKSSGISEIEGLVDGELYAGGPGPSPAPAPAPYY